eukprot:4896690-Amphidinium_carterae.1
MTQAVRGEALSLSYDHQETEKKSRSFSSIILGNWGLQLVAVMLVRDAKTKRQLRKNVGTTKLRVIDGFVQKAWYLQEASPV